VYVAAMAYLLAGWFLAEVAEWEFLRGRRGLSGLWVVVFFFAMWPLTLVLAIFIAVSIRKGR